MSRVLIDRIRDRIEELGLSPITAAKEVGLERGFINDLLIGKKKTVRADKLELLAQALRCNPEFLTGTTGDHRPLEPVTNIPFGGICETGVFRHEAAIMKTEWPKMLDFQADWRYPDFKQYVFEVRGDGFDREGIIDGMFVTGVDFDQWREEVGPLEPGLQVVVRNEIDAPNGPLVELSLRKATLEGTAINLIARQADPLFPFPPLRQGEGVSIIAVVTEARRIFPRDLPSRK